MNRFDSIHRDMNTNKHGNMHGDMYGKRASKDVLFGIAGYGADKVLPVSYTHLRTLNSLIIWMRYWMWRDWGECS